MRELDETRRLLTKEKQRAAQLRVQLVRARHERGGARRHVRPRR